MSRQQLGALAGLVVVGASVYFADDFVREFGIRALPFGALIVFGICYALIRPPPQQPNQQQ